MHTLSPANMLENLPSFDGAPPRTPVYYTIAISRYNLHLRTCQEWYREAFDDKKTPGINRRAGSFLFPVFPGLSPRRTADRPCTSPIPAESNTGRRMVCRRRQGDLPVRIRMALYSPPSPYTDLRDKKTPPNKARSRLLAPVRPGKIPC